jgi:hypothetical protein
VKPRSVVLTLAILVVVLALAYAVSADGGGTLARWFGSLHGRPGGH